MLALSAALPPAAQAANGKEPRIALVIGNSKYPFSPLHNPSNDARKIAASLRAVGFHVIEKIDASRRDMRRSMIDFGRRLSDGGVGLFYYAGHGIQIKGSNYLIPVDAEIEAEDHVEVEGVALNQVLARMGGARNRLNIVILDACRNNPFKRSFRSAAKGLAQTLAPAGTYIAYATAPGAVAEDGVGSNSLYTQALARWIREPGLKIEDVFKRVRVGVVNSTDQRQVPWTSSSITGEFYFTPKPKEAPKPPPVAKKPPQAPPKPVAQGPDRRTLELTFWQSIKDSDSTAEYREFVKQFPKSVFAGLAQKRIAALEAKAAAAATSERRQEAAARNAQSSRSQQLAALPPDLAPQTRARARPHGSLPAAGIERLLAGATLKRFRVHDETRITVNFHSGGRISGKALKGARETEDTGVWKTDGDLLCTQWQRWKKGVRRCFFVVPQGNGAVTLLLKDGDEVARYTLERGKGGGADLVSLLTGKEIHFSRRRDGRAMKIVLAKEGRVELYVANLIGDWLPRGEGRWWFKKRLFCVRVGNFNRGERTCSNIAVEGRKLTAYRARDKARRPWTFR